MLKNHKTVMKIIEENKNNGTLFNVHVLEKLILLKCVYHPKQY
jgi:hypothetical protein